MLNRILSIVPALSLAALVVAGPTAPPNDPGPAARAALAAAAHAYRAAPELSDTMTYTVRAPNADLEPKKLEIRLGSGKDASVADPLLSAFAVGKTLYVTKSDAPGKFVVAPYAGDFARSLNSIVGDEGSLFEPPQIAMRTGKSVDAVIDSLRFKMLGPLHVSGYKRRSVAGRTLDIVSLTATNGSVELKIDRATRFLSAIHAHLEPAGAPAGVSVEIDGQFSPTVLPKGFGAVAFDPRSGRAVARLADLSSENLPVGGPAPAFVLEAAAGERVSLAALKGRVVVIDFWATWCAPCWKTLAETEKIASWASASGAPVSVLALNTMEQFKTEEARRAAIIEFVKNQKLSMPTLLDRGDEIFKAFGSPGLPSMVIVAPDGTIFRYHQGMFPDILETVKRDVSEAESARPGS